MSVCIIHNILWSKYKAAVFNELQCISIKSNVSMKFVQIAETENDRIGLSSVDKECHKYDYKLLCSGSIEKNSWIKRSSRLINYLESQEWRLVVIPGYYRPEYWAALMYCLLKGIKIGLFCDSTYSDAYTHGLRLLLKRFFVRFCDVYFAYGIRSHEYLVFLGADPNRIKTRCQAAALPSNYSPEEIIRKRIKKRNLESACTVLYVGRLSPEKDLITLLNAWKVVSVKWPSASLDIIGSGPQERDLKLLVESMGLLSRVRFLGAKDIDTIYDAYTSSDLLVLPSMREPWGLVVNEALSFGCPVVVSDRCGCVPELVHDGKSGFQFRAGDAEDLSDKIDRALDHFSKNDDYASYCIELMRAYTSANAAQQILAGCQSALART